MNQTAHTPACRLPTITIIVAPCRADGTAIHGISLREDFTYIDLNVNKDTPLHEAALREGKKFVGPGLAVIVRPNYNELVGVNGERHGYREWRSFNGEAFEECRFGHSDLRTLKEWAITQHPNPLDILREDHARAQATYEAAKMEYTKYAYGEPGNLEALRAFRMAGEKLDRCEERLNAG